MPDVSVGRFIEKLARSEPIPGILLLGADLYLRDMCRAKIIEAFVAPGLRDLATARLSAAELPLATILRQAQMAPMFAPRQVIFVEEIDALEQLGDAARDAAVDELAAYLDAPAPFTMLVLEAAKLDERMRLFKQMSKSALVVQLELGSAADAAKLAAEMACELGVEIDRAAAEELIDAVNGELARMHVELEKLAAYVGERKRITPADVDALVVTEHKYSVWELAEILAGRKRDQALVFLESVLRTGEPAPAVVGALAWMYRKLLEAQELPPRTADFVAARKLGIRRPETAALALRQSRRIPRDELLAGLAALAEADSRLKSGGADERTVMEFLVARLAAPAPSRANT